MGGNTIMDNIFVSDRLARFLFSEKGNANQDWLRHRIDEAMALAAFLSGTEFILES